MDGMEPALDGGAADLAKPTKRARSGALSSAASKWTKTRRGEFLELLGEAGNACEAARAVGMSSASAWRLRGQDPAFAHQWDEALAMFVANVELIVLRRIAGGYERPRYHRGEQVGTDRIYNDSAGVALLKAQKSERRGGTADAGAASAARPGQAGEQGRLMVERMLSEIAARRAAAGTQ